MPPEVLVTRPFPAMETRNDGLAATVVAANADAASRLVRATAATAKMMLRRFISPNSFLGSGTCRLKRARSR
jgi:hypothetical protein